MYVFNIYYLADTYKAIKNYDKCSFYNNLGLLKSNEYKVFYMKNYFILCEGSNLIFKKNYNKAINNLSKILPSINDEPNKLAINYYLGKAYQGLKNTDKALLYFKKVDSIDAIHKIVSPEFIDGYHFLINYYKEKKQPDKQLYYTNRFITIDSIFQINYKNTIKKIQKDYDMPLVLSQKEALIQDLKGESKQKYVVIFALILVIIGVSIYLSQKNKKAIKRFNQIIQELEQAKTEVPKEKSLI